MSPFVPKPHTPFQWEPQIPVEEMHRRIHIVLEDFKREKSLKLRWHEPAISRLEGLFSRGDRRLADVVEKAYRKGAVFPEWKEYFNPVPWDEALAECGLTYDEYTRARGLDEPLPWNHLETGIDPAYLLRERERAFAGKTTADCRYHACNMCGACDVGKATSRLARDPSDPTRHENRLVFSKRDQADCSPKYDAEGRLIAPPKQGRKTAPPAIGGGLGVKAVRYRVWHTKQAEFAYISQLELQSFLERLLRRAALPMAFSQGFHPMPLVSFGRALPVGVESLAEWFTVTLRQPLSPDQVREALTPHLVRGMQLMNIEPIPLNLKAVGSLQETFMLSHAQGRLPAAMKNAWETFTMSSEVILERETKNGPRTNDIRPLFTSIAIGEDRIDLVLDWTKAYISPLVLFKAVTPDIPAHLLRIVKVSQVL